MHKNVIIDGIEYAPVKPALKPLRTFDINSVVSSYGTKAEATLVSNGVIYPREFIRAVELPEGSIVVNRADLSNAWERCEKHLYTMCKLASENVTLQNFLKELGL